MSARRIDRSGWLLAVPVLLVVMAPALIELSMPPVPEPTPADLQARLEQRRERALSAASRLAAESAVTFSAGHRIGSPAVVCRRPIDPARVLCFWQWIGAPPAPVTCGGDGDCTPWSETDGW